MKAIYRVLWLAILTAHATGALAWWWMRPGGFPVTSVHFWSGAVAPWVIVAVVIVARFSTKKCPSLSAWLLLSIPIAWIAASVASTLVFPITFHVLWVAPFLVGVMM